MARTAPTSDEVTANVIAIAESTIALAEKQADGHLSQARGPEWMEERLAELDTYIREMSRMADILGPDGTRDLREAKEERRGLRQERDNVVKPHMENSLRWRGLAGNLGQQVRKLRRSPSDHERLRTLIDELRQVSGFLSRSDNSRLQEGVDFLRMQKLRTSQAAAPKPPQPAVPEGPVSISVPEAPDVEFGEDAEDLVEALARLDVAPHDAYELNVAAQHLSLMTGFEELLCLPLLHDVEHLPHQINTARQVLRTMRGRALLCDEVGLGKTVEAGLILKEYYVRGLVRKVLILTPPSLVGQWQEQMTDKFGIDFTTHDDPAFRGAGPEAWGSYDRVIASLATARSTAQSASVQAQKYDLLIVDEAHHLKNRNTASWKLVNGISTKYVLLLTATPAENNLDELFNLITLLSPGQLKTPAAFRREFVERGDPRQPKNRTKLRELLMDVMIRNTRSQVSVKLPPRRAHTVRIDLTPVERRLYDGVSDYVRKLARESSRSRMLAHTLQAEAGSSSTALYATLQRLAERDSGKSEDVTRLLALAREAAGEVSAKEHALVDILKESREKVLIFTQYRETQRRVASVLRSSGFTTAVFDGSMSSAEKDDQVTAFAGDARILCSTDVGSEGRNLQFCHTVLNFDLPWNPMRIEQRVGRVHRIGQTEPVRIVNLAARDTLEDLVLEILDSKINMFELVVGEIGEILGNLDDEQDFEDIVLQIWAGASSAAAAREAFTELGNKVVLARSELEKTREYDEALFGTDFVAEV